ncbi:MAG: DUF3050 domain-containing protein [Bacteroidetes bacterium]|nr:DUF3050 domain-containing protein [Bacteroidota bacterium]
MSTRLQELKKQLEPERIKLLSHPVYTKIKDLEGLRKFASVHVFAVWDFMSLLKSLQNSLTSVSIPWMPVGSPSTRYLINEIVLGEESDVDEEGVRISHFELYLKAMHRMDADTTAIESLLSLVRSGTPVRKALNEINIPDNVKKFLQFTFDIALDAQPHIQAAVFTFGREDLIPSMFNQLLEQLYSETPEKVCTFKYYIERHIEVDGEHHSHLATQMVSELCGTDEEKWSNALNASKKALELRYLLWDAVSA